MQRDMTVDASRWIVNAAAERQIQLQVEFIMFTADSSTEQLLDNASFIHDIGIIYRMKTLARTALAFPGTELWRRVGGNYDKQRSTPFLRYPVFASREIRELSMAFEDIEEQFAVSDGMAYRAQGSGKLSDGVSKQLSGLIREAFQRVVAAAQAGGTRHHLVELARPYRDEAIRLLQHI